MDLIGLAHGIEREKGGGHSEFRPALNGSFSFNMGMNTAVLS
jgi:hypothetical protein